MVIHAESFFAGGTCLAGFTPPARNTLEVDE